ncbi:DUF7594 domain-containing protein [Actinopolymorpha alba]|uniref:CBM96 family carbohydrate-binding protein n=1 Tax=Actinopolymorpha alba TaxID=533267 RepID=UPI00035CFD67|nr:DNRLRE domain-containing protein [Actinopolymorpha alba]
MRRRTFVTGSLAAAAAATTSAAAWGLSAAHPRPALADDVGAIMTASVISEHPRLMLHDLATLKARATANDTLARWYAKVKADADAIVPLPVSKYVIPDGLRLLDTSREVVRRTYSLAVAFAVENDPAYSNRLWAELNAAAHFPDWNSQRHFLDTAEMTHAFAIGYDWLFHVWTDEQRAVLRQAMVEFGLKPGLRVYESAFGWHTGTNNWNIVCNSGLSLGALALAQDEPTLCTQILDHALRSIPRAIAEYAPNGGYPEGLGSYWGYATKYLLPYLESLRTATGDDHGLSQSAGLAETGYFPIHLTGPAGENFNYYDAGGGSPQPPEMFWLARTYATPVFGWWGVQGMDRNPVSWLQSPLSLLWYDADQVKSPLEADLAFDGYFGRCEVATMRSGWENRTATFAGFKGGNNSTSHGDLDLGNFVFDALGLRWAIELGSDDYNMPGYFAGGPGGQRWTYYRKRAEGQNTLIVNPRKGDDQVVTATGTIISRASGPTAAYAIADLTEAHPALTSWRRGVRQFDNRQQLLVQDELTAAEPAEVWWFMHTAATIAVAADGRSARLTRGGQQVLARITSPEGAVFYNAAAKPLWTSPDPDVQNDNLGIRKLAIRLTGVTNPRVAVQLTPVREGQEAPPAEPVTPLSGWSVGPAKVDALKSLSVDGKALEEFSSRTFVYDVLRPRGAKLPVVTATPAGEGDRVMIHPVRRLPGAATIDVTSPGKARARYQIFFRTEIGPGNFPSTIIASADDGNVPENTMDGNPATRWSAEGDGQWIAYDLGADGPVSSVTIAWYQGDKRASRFDLEVAPAGGDWRQVFSGSSSGTRATPETYTFDEVSARYLRIVGHGNTANAWNSIIEVTIPGRTVTLPATDPFLASVLLTAPDSMHVGGTARLELAGTLSDGTPADLSDATISYATDDPAAATTSDDGTLTAVGEGSVTVAGIVVSKDWRLEYARRTVTVVDPSKVRVPAAADTYVNDGANANTNYGTSTTLLVKTVQPAGSGYTRQAFLRFQPEAVRGTIESITLQLHASVNDTGGTEIDVEVHESATFDEKTVTWNTKPAIGANLGLTHITSTAAWYAVDLTEQLRSAVAAGQPINLALIQNPPAGQGGLATNIRSRESAQGPYLLVNLSTASG